MLNNGVELMAHGLIIQGLNNRQVLAAVRLRFPQRHTTDASIRTYRSRLKKRGYDVSVRSGVTPNLRLVA